MFRRTTPKCIGTISTFLANIVLYAASTHINTPFSTLVFGGAVYRTLTLPFSIYGDQCLSRVACALPELQEAHAEYLSVANHPKAISWEKKVAAQKLKNDRERIFRGYRANNIKMVVPHIVSLVTSWYMLCIPAQQIGHFFTVTLEMSITSPFAFAIPSPSHQVVSALSVAEAGSSASTVATIVDPTLSLAATLTLYSVLQHLKRREGFNDMLDGWIHTARRHVLTGYVAFALAALLSNPIAALLGTTTFFPSYLGPVWLGMASVTAAKNLLLNGTAPGRALCRFHDYPPQHGTYGTVSTAEAHEYRLEVTSVDAEEKRDMWHTQKKALDYECDVRIHNILSRIGLFSTVDELEYEVDKLERKRAVVRARQDKTHEGEGEEESERKNDFATSAHAPGTPAARRVRREGKKQKIGRESGAAVDTEEMMKETLDQMQVEENQRRRDRRAAREQQFKE